jgi:hypothetical protein
MTPWTGVKPSQASTYTQNNTKTEKMHAIQTSMSWVGFEPTIPLFKQAKTVHALGRAATVIGITTHIVPQTWEELTHKLQN